MQLFEVLKGSVLCAILASTTNARAEFLPDQKTWDLVRNLVVERVVVSPTSLPGNRMAHLRVLGLVHINSLNAVTPDIKVDEAKISFVPGPPEVRVFRAANCSNAKRKFSDKLELEIESSLSLTMNQTVSTSTEFKANEGFTLGPLKMGADFEQKNAFSLASTSVQTVHTKRTESRDDSQDLDPWTALYYKVEIKRGKVSAPVAGTAIINANLDLTVHIDLVPPLPIDYPIQTAPGMMLSTIIPEPGPRTIPISGTLVGDRYEDVQINFIGRPVTETSPECILPTDLPGTSSNPVRILPSSLADLSLALTRR